MSSAIAAFLSIAYPPVEGTIPEATSTLSEIIWGVMASVACSIAKSDCAMLTTVVVDGFISAMEFNSPCWFFLGSWRGFQHFNLRGEVLKRLRREQRALGGLDAHAFASDHVLEKGS